MAAAGLGVPIWAARGTERLLGLAAQIVGGVAGPLQGYALAGAGDVDSAIPTGANYVNEGDYIGVVTTGACDTTCITTFTIVIDRD